MSSNNNDTNQQIFEDESNDEHDFYQLVLARYDTTITLTSYKGKETL